MINTVKMRIPTKSHYWAVPGQIKKAGELTEVQI
jgi:hypothetical protein